MFVRIGTPDYGEAEISAGAFAFNGQHIALGTYSGWALLDGQTLECIASDPHLLPQHNGINGLQFCGPDLMMLGNHKSQSFCKPADWESCLYRMPLGRSPTRTFDLPPGNWRLVKHTDDPRVVIYDVSEDVGLLGWSPDNKTWRADIGTIMKAVHAQGQVICLSQTHLFVFDLSGRALRELPLPRQGEFSWTAATLTGGDLVLGGYRKETHAYCLAILDSANHCIRHMTEYPLERVFDRTTIDLCFADECCGNDLYHVARIMELAPKVLVLALGGSGEGLGACQGAGALAIVALDDTRNWSTQVIGTEDGISGLARRPDGQVIVDICGELHLFRAPVIPTSAAT